MAGARGRALGILLSCVGLASATVAYVHHAQVAERQRMRVAVLLDLERERARS